MALWMRETWRGVSVRFPKIQTKKPPAVEAGGSLLR
jgi:hypothetical protein